MGLRLATLEAGCLTIEIKVKCAIGSYLLSLLILKGYQLQQTVPT